jgi:hypothetical protein
VGLRPGGDRPESTDDQTIVLRMLILTLAETIPTLQAFHDMAIKNNKPCILFTF